MQKDSFKSYKLTKEALVLQGSRCELSVSFADLAVIIPRDTQRDEGRV